MKLLISQILDEYIRENFKRIQEESDKDILKDFALVDLTFSAAVTNYKYRHGLGSIPLDVLQTHLTGAGSVTWNYSLFDRDFLDITTTGPCRVRAFVGTHKRR